MSRESKLDEILNSIRTNALDLSRSGYSDIQMIRTAVNRGGRLLKGQIKEQDVIDIKKKQRVTGPLLRNAPWIDPQEHKENRGISAFII